MQTISISKNTEETGIVNAWRFFSKNPSKTKKCISTVSITDLFSELFCQPCHSKQWKRCSGQGRTRPLSNANYYPVTFNSNTSTSVRLRGDATGCCNSRIRYLSKGDPVVMHGKCKRKKLCRPQKWFKPNGASKYFRCDRNDKDVRNSRV